MDDGQVSNNMSFLRILCEGETEQAVLKEFLRPFWQERFQHVQVESYLGNGTFKTNFSVDVLDTLTQDMDASVLCLIDLYKEPFNIYKPGQMSIKEGFTKVQEYMLSRIPKRYHVRVGVFPVVMELETWLLGDENIQSSLEINIPQPETHTSAYQVIAQARRKQRKSYSKKIDGINFFRRASAKRVYDDNCPHFCIIADWLSTQPTVEQSLSDMQLTEKQQQWEDKQQALSERVAKLQAEFQRSSDEKIFYEGIVAEEELEAFLRTFGDVFHK